MNIDNILKLLKSSNEDDILLGYTILIKKYTLEEINEFIKPMEIVFGYERFEGPKFFKIRLGNSWLNTTNWIKID